MGLSEEQLDELGTKYGRVVSVQWDGHEIVFRRPTIEECRAWRVKGESVDAKVDRADQHCQQTLVSFDGDMSPVTSRTKFSQEFLREHPMFATTSRCMAALGVLMGVVEEKDFADLGKGVSVRPSPRPSTPAA